MIGVVIIRQAQPDDAQNIAEIHVRSWQSAYEGQLPQGFLDALDAAQRASGWRSVIEGAADPRERTLVAEDADTLMGFAHLRPTRDEDEDSDVTGEVTSIYLNPNHWRTGVGRQLIAAALDALRDSGHVTATLWVLSTNVRAIRFYEACGWEPDGVTKHVGIAGTSRTELRYRHRL